MELSAPWIARAALALFLGLLLWAAVHDLRRFRIPNLLNALLLALFFPVVLLLPAEVDWLSHLGAAGLILALGLGFFCFGWLGAGDVKIMTALALWAGFGRLFDLMVFVTLAGGLLSLVLWVLRRKAAQALPAGFAPAPDPLADPDLGPDFAVPHLLRTRYVPYGVAIALGAMLAAPRFPAFGLAF